MQIEYVTSATEKKGSVTRYKGEVQAGDYAADRKGMLFVSLIGTQQATLAMWANLVKARRERTPTPTNVKIRVDGRMESIRVTPGIKYYKIILSEAPFTILLLREEFSCLHYEYIMGGSEEKPSPWFDVALKNAMPEIPYKREWLPVMWRAAMNKSLIVPPTTLKGDIWVWRIIRGDKWKLLMERLIINQEVS